jgi:hypothetical protein
MLLQRLVLVVLAGTLLTSGLACKKSGVSDGSFTLKGAQEVVGALDRRDYEGAIVALPGIKAELPEDKATKEWEEYRRLLQKVKTAVIEAMGTNQAAAKAFDTLRFMEIGR